MGKATSGTGIVYYSRSGHSERLAQRLAVDLGGELLELRAPAYDPPFFGYARAAYDSLRQRDMPVSGPMPSVAGFARIVLCGPVWTSYPAVPLRTFLRAHRQQPGPIALFLTSGGHSPAHKAFAAAAADLNRPLAAISMLPNAAEGTDEEERSIAAFLVDLERAAPLSDVDFGQSTLPV